MKSLDYAKKFDLPESVINEMVFNLNKRIVARKGVLFFSHEKKDDRENFFADYNGDLENSYPDEDVYNEKYEMTFLAGKLMIDNILNGDYSLLTAKTLSVLKPNKLG